MTEPSTPSNFQNQVISTQVDAKGLTCPEPVMMLHSAVRDAQAGGLIRVEATDPSTKKDIANFCEFLGHPLVYHGEANGIYEFIVRKKI